MNGAASSGNGVSGSFSSYPLVGPWGGAEAPSIFWGNGLDYMIFSLPRCPYCWARTGYATAPTMGGPWTYRGTVSENSCDAQPDQVDMLPNGSGGTTYLYSSDQWIWDQVPGSPGQNNQTAATQHWEPLTFGSGGQPAQLTCAPTFSLTVAG